MIRGTLRRRGSGAAPPRRASEETAQAETAQAEAAPPLRITGLSKTIGRSSVFADVTLTAGPGDMLVLTGPDGSGKTMLLLSLLGRMTVDSGSGQVAGFDLRRQTRQVRDHTAVANVSVLTGLESAMTVRQHIAERLIMNSPWYLPVARRGRVDAITERLMETVGAIDEQFAQLPPAVLEPLGLSERPDLALRPDAYVDSLNDLQRLVVEVILACMSPATVVGVDDVDLLRTQRDRTWAWLFLLQLSGLREGFGIPHTTLITTCQETTELDQLHRALCEAGAEPAPAVQVALPGKES